MSGEESKYRFQEFSDTQQRIYDRAVQHYAAYQEVKEKILAFRGGMHWKRIKGREYLYQYADRYGHGKSLGPRSPQTQEIYAAFTRERHTVQEQLRGQRQRLAEQARFCQAALIQRVPRLAAHLLRHLEQDDSLGPNLLVIGSNAIYAYEFAARVFLAAPQNAAQAYRLLSGSRQGLALATHLQLMPARLLEALHQADRSFQVLPGKDFQAVNRRGYTVKVLTSGARPKNQSGPMGPGGAGTQELSSLLASPKFSQVVIGADGFPVTMVVPDPRAFALHKLWLSQQAVREAGKRSGDQAQALAVADLILRYLPQYHFFSAELRLFPEEFVRRAEKSVEGLELALELDIDY